MISSAGPALTPTAAIQPIFASKAAMADNAPAEPRQLRHYRLGGRPADRRTHRLGSRMMDLAAWRTEDSQSVMARSRAVPRFLGASSKKQCLVEAAARPMNHEQGNAFACFGIFEIAEAGGDHCAEFGCNERPALAIAPPYANAKAPPPANPAVRAPAPSSTLRVTMTNLPTT